MRMVTRQPLAASIKLGSSKHNIYVRKFLKWFPFAAGGHFIFVRYALNKIVPLMPLFANSQSIIDFILGVCLCAYPVLLLGSLKRAKVNFKSDVDEAKNILVSISEDMNVMGLDVSLENLLSANVELKSHKEGFIGISAYRINEESIIKIKNRKSKLLILRECTSLIQEYAYKETMPDTIVHLLEDDEYQEEINRKQLTSK